MSSLTTLCYIERDGEYLMMHRNKKENDVNEGKWIGVGGHFEANESPDECLLREVKEETGLELMDYSCKGIVTFVSAKGVTEYMFLYHSNDFIGELKECDEGELEWVDKSRLFDLELWEGDRSFLGLMQMGAPFFSMKLEYDEDDNLIRESVDGEVIKDRTRESY